MTLKNFEAHTSAPNLKSGLSFFQREKVMDLLESTAGNWSASIWDRKYFEISVQLKNSSIVKADCECRKTASTDFCKHIVATLYAIQHAKGIIKEQDAFLSSDPGAIGGASSKDRDEMTRYAQLIREPFTKAQDVTGHIYRDQTNRVLRVPEKLLENAQDLLSQNKIGEAANITLAVIETVNHCCRKLEHGFDSTMDIFDTAFEILQNIIAANPPKKLLDRFYEHAISGGLTPEKDMRWFDTRWITLLVERKLYEGQDDQTIQPAFKKLIARAKIDKADSVLRELEALRSKYYRDNNLTESVEIKIPSKPSSTSPGISLTSDTPSLVKGLEDAKKSGNTKKIEMYRQCLYAERRSKNDRIGAREMAVELFNTHPTAPYLEFIRETYTQVQWEQVESEYTSKLKVQAG